MRVTQLRDGLWIWSLPHPAWTPDADRPDGWPRIVNCLYCETRGASGTTIVLIDPLVPEPTEEPALSEAEGRVERDRFFEAMDRDRERAGGRVEILVGNEFHGRSANALCDRYAPRGGSDVWAHETYPDKPECRPTRRFRDGDTLPGGVVAHNTPALSPAETLFWIPEHRALYAADALAGIGGDAVRIVPASWAEKDAASQERFEREFRPSLRRLLELPIEILVTAHGDPVTSGGRAALEVALAAPPLGAGA